MKKLLTILFLLVFVAVKAQYTPNAGAYQYKGLKQTNSLQPPSTAGSPVTSVNAPDSNYAALYYNKTDTTWYQFNPISKTWSPFRANGGVTIDSIFISSIDSIFITQTDSIFIISGNDTIFIGESDHVRDTAYLNAGFGTVILSPDLNDSLGFYAPNYSDRTIVVDTAALLNYFNNYYTNITNPPPDSSTFTYIVYSIDATPNLSYPDGTKVLVASSGTTGSFVGHENDIATLVGGVYTFTDAASGDQLLLSNDADPDNPIVRSYRFDGTNWILTAIFVVVGGQQIGAPLPIGTNDSNNFVLKTNDTGRVTITPVGDVLINKYEGLENEQLFFKPGIDGKLDTGRFTIPEYDSPAIQDSIMYVDAGVIKYGTASGGGGGGTTDVQSITATASQTDFTFTDVPASYTDYWIDINGSVINQAVFYTTSGNTITFSEGLDADDIVTFHRTK